MKLRNSKGFTLIEMIITLTVMTIITTAALPRIINIVGIAKGGARDTIVGAVRSGISMVQLGTIDENNPFGNLPAELDSVAAGVDCNTGNGCFGNVLEPGHDVKDSRWTKTGSTTYDYDTGPDVASYEYNTANGTFNCTGGACQPVPSGGIAIGGP